MHKLTQSMVMMFALAGSAALYAQAPQQDGQAPHPHGQFQHHGPNPEFETKMLTKRLNLSPEQAAQVEPILAGQHDQMKALKPADGAQPDFKAMHEQRKAIMDATKQKLDAVLTPEQQEKFAKMHEHQFHGGPHGQHTPQNGTAPSA